MPKEGEQRFRVKVSGVHVDLENKKVTLEAAGAPLAHLHWSLEEGTVIFEVPRGPAVDLTEADAPGLPAQVEAAARKEKDNTVTVSGRLKSQPRPGRPDAKGKPTAWAQLAAHHEDEDEAHMYSATFHRHTVPIALKLPKDAQVTVQGYPHSAEEAGRMDTFSVINIVQYPGKPSRQK